MDAPGESRALEKDQIARIQINTQNTEEYKPIQFGQDQRFKPEDYANKDKRKDKELETAITSYEKLNSDDVREILQKKSAYNQARMQQLVRDTKWYSLFNRESPEMTYVKQSLNYLNNVMDKELPIDQKSRRIDCKAIEQMLKPAYVTVLEACDQYISTHQGKRHSTGRRRLAYVQQVREMITAEQHMLNLAVSNIQDGALYDQQNAKCLRDIFPRVQVNKAVISRYVLEGNSSDVYRILLQGGKMYFYAKKDVKLLNEDLGGFVGRRLKQLQKSRQNRAGYAADNAQYL